MERHLIKLYSLPVFALIMITLMLVPASAETYSGVEFPDGAASFADEVISHQLNGGAAGDDITSALGIPDRRSTSLGAQGFIVLKFTNNSLTTSGNSDPDLFIYEAGNTDEYGNVSISEDGTNWIWVGVINRKTSLDIDGVPGIIAGSCYCYVKIVDINGVSSSSAYEGVDIESVGAISSAPPMLGRSGNDIPEFPTVAIPVMLVVGMAFIFFRGKDE